MEKIETWIEALERGTYLFGKTYGGCSKLSQTNVYKYSSIGVGICVALSNPILRSQIGLEQKDITAYTESTRTMIEPIRDWYGLPKGIIARIEKADEAYGNREGAIKILKEHLANKDDSALKS